MRLLERLRACMPSREYIHNHRWLAWLGPHLSHPKLWHWSRRGVALGVALGIFFGLLIPIAQIPASVITAVVLRANVPAAAASTLITNPVTFGPIYYAAYHLGAWVNGDKRAAQQNWAEPDATKLEPDVSIWQRLSALGKPLVLGLAILATLIGLLTYGLITLVWRWRSLAKRRSRRQP